jgi:hypothetical protein
LPQWSKRLMDKLDHLCFQSISHWGLIDTSLPPGVVTIECDSEGNEINRTFETADEAMPLLVVQYENRGMLVITGDHASGLVRERIWMPHLEGALPPHDAFTSGMDLGVPANVMRH